MDFGEFTSKFARRQLATSHEAARAESRFNVVDGVTRRGESVRQECEVSRTVDRIYGGALSSGTKGAEQDELPPFDPVAMCERAALVPFEVTEDWLAEVSPEAVI